MKGTSATGAILATAAIAASLLAGCSPAQPKGTATPGWVSRAPSATPTPTPSPTPTATAWDLALEEAGKLTATQAAGQVIMPDISSATPDAAARLVRSHHLAGVLLMGGAITDEKGVKALTAAIAAADPERDWPVMIATDEEGGTVQRLQPVVGYVSAFMAAGANGDATQVRDYYAGLGVQLAALGFTMDMAPVADVTMGLADPTIRTRSAGSSPDAVAGVATAAWQGLEAGGVTPVVKHFPGHGTVTADSHTSLPVQPKSVAELAASDLVPFASAADAGVPAMMMGHIQVGEWGAAPASVNPLAYAYVRDTLDFDGLVMTDAMNMEAITDLYGADAAAAAAIAAGADLVVMPANIDTAIAGIVAAVTAGNLPRERLDDAVAHVILAARAQGGSTPGALADRPAALVEGSIVVSAKDCSALVGSSVKLSGGTAAQRKVLAAELSARGISVGERGTSVLLVDGDRGHGNATVVVAMGGPWGLPQSTANAYVATWGSGPEQLRALAAVLTGDVAPRGHWPVALKLPYGECG